MNNLEVKKSISSLKLVEQINLFRKEEGKTVELLHKSLLGIIRDEFDEEIQEQKILLSFKTRQLANGGSKEDPYYILTFSQAKQILVRESKYVRKHIIAYIEQLENALLQKQVPQTFVEALRAYADEIEKNEKLQLENNQQKQIISELQPKADYCDLILKSKDCLTITQIAKDYGLTARLLNKVLQELDIQFKISGQWLLKDKYSRSGYTKSETIKYEKPDNEIGIKLHTKWTQKGRLFLYEQLKNINIFPLIEQ